MINIKVTMVPMIVAIIVTTTITNAAVEISLIAPQC